MAATREYASGKSSQARSSASYLGRAASHEFSTWPRHAAENQKRPAGTAGRSELMIDQAGLAASTRARAASLSVNQRALISV